MTEGFVYLHRSLLDWQHFQQPSVLQVFITLLLLANWKDGWFRGKRVRRGEMYTTTERLQTTCNLSYITVGKCLEKLEESGEIEMKRVCNVGTWIKITNYHKFNPLNPLNFEGIDIEIDKEIPKGIGIEDRIKNNKEINIVDVVEEKPTRIFQSEKKIKAEDIYDWLRFESGQMWQETAMMQLGIHGLDELHILFRRFQSEVIAQGRSEETERGIKAHFINQTRIYLRKKKQEEQNEQRGNQSRHTDPRQLELIAQQMLDHERSKGMAD